VAGSTRPGEHFTRADPSMVDCPVTPRSLQGELSGLTRTARSTLRGFGAMCRERQRVSVAAGTTVLNVTSNPKPIHVSSVGVWCPPRFRRTVGRREDPIRLYDRPA
jgi:hypothetical protein